MSIPDPVVLLDARAKYVHPAFQMTRASTKTVFDSAGRLVTVPANALGWDHDPATGRALGYLAEPSATNLLLHSNDLTEGVWTKDRVTIGSPISGPDGADVGKLVESSDAGTHGVRQVVTISDGNSVAARFIARAGERFSISLRLGDNTDMSTRVQVDINLTDGSFSTASVGGASVAFADVRYIGSGFYACCCAGTLGPGVTAARLQVLVTHQGSSSYFGDGVSGLYLGYFQAEEGSIPTSYIETGAATATRAGDSLLLSDLSDFPWFAASKGTFAWEYELGNTVPLGGMVTILGSTFTVRQSASGQGTVLVGNAIIDTNFIPSADTEIGKYMRAWFAYDATGYSAGYNGNVSRDGEVTGSIPTSGLFRIGNNNHIRFYRITYYPALISNADLQSLTAIQE